MEEFERYTWETCHFRRIGRKLQRQACLTERIMGIPNDALNPLSRQSFENTFKRMGFLPRRRA